MPATLESYTNNGVTSVQGGAGGRGTVLNAADTTVYIGTGDHAKLPSTTPFRVQIGATEWAQVTAVDSVNDKLTVVRGNNLSGPDNSPAGTWPLNTTIANGATAGTLANIVTAINTDRPYYPEDYGVTGGTTDDVAINAALAAAQAAGGGVVQLGNIKYKTSAAVVIPSSYVHLRGAGMDATVIQPGVGANYDAVALGTTASTSIEGAGVHDLTIDCSNMTGATAFAGNALHLYATHHCFFTFARLLNSPNWGVMGDDAGHGNNYANSFYRLKIDECSGGIWARAGEENTYLNCWVYGGANTTAATQGGNGASSTTAYPFKTAFCNLQNILSCSFNLGAGGLTQEVVHLQASYCRFIGNYFDSAPYQALNIGGSYNVITGNNFGSASQVGSVEVITLGGDHNLISDNVCIPDNLHYTYAISETGAHVGNTITGNHFTPGTSGVFNLNSGSTNRVRDNPSYNPLVPLLPPQQTPGLTVQAGGTMPLGVYQVVFTYVNSFGESLGSVTGSATTTSGNQTLKISSPPFAGNASGWYAYVTQAGAGTFYRQQTAGSPTKLNSSLTLTANPTTTGANPPVSNTTAGFAQPAVPSSTTPYRNGFQVDCTVYIAGGTVSQIKVGDLVTGLTGGTIRVPAGVYVTLTYTVAPTWVWAGD